MASVFTWFWGVLLTLASHAPAILILLLFLALVIASFYAYHTLFVAPAFTATLRTIQDKFLLGISQVTGGIESVENTVKAYKDNEDIKHNQIETKMEEIHVGIRANNEQLLIIKDDMNTYKIVNHEVLSDELDKIGAVVYYSSTAATNILSEALISFRDHPERVVISNDQLLHDITKDVQKDRLKYHTQLVTQGVSPRTVQLWEETEGEMFERFAFWIIQFYERFQTMRGNGTVTELIKTEANTLKDRFFREFMTTFKGKLSIIKS